MIHKLVRIKNVGQYSSTAAPFVEWNGVLGKLNIIYGENRSGKTTFSLILRSLSGDDALIQRKRSFNATSEPEVLFIEDGGSVLEYKAGKWNRHLPNIKVFDIHYIEENLYTGYVATQHNQENMFEIVLGTQGRDLKDKINELREKQHQLLRERKRIKLLSRKLLKEGKEAAAQELEEERGRYSQMIAPLAEQIKTLTIQLGVYSQGIFETHASRINYYLNIFAPGIKIEKFTKSLSLNLTFSPTNNRAGKVKH